MKKPNNLKKIILVDDDKDIRFTLENLLIDYGYTVVSVENGKEALKKLKNNKFDLIISDILMPVMDGYQLLKNLKDNNKLKNIPFVFFTGTYTDKKDKELAIKLGADKYIEKPLEFEIFIKTIQGIIEDNKSGKLKPKKPALEQEEVILKLYSGQLVHKLEKKLKDLETEIIQRKKAEKALQESEERYKNIIENSQLGMLIIKDKPIRISFVNTPMEKLSGYTSDEIMHFTPDKIISTIHPEDRKALFKNFKARIKGEIFSTNHKFRLIIKDNDIRWIEMFSTLITYKGSQAIQSTFLDYTEKTQIEALMIKTSRMEATTTLATGIAHDYNNLMVGVLGNAELLKMQFTKNLKIANKLNTIANNAKKAGELSQQLIAFARGGKYNPQILNLNNIIKDTLHLNEQSFPTKVHIKKKFDPELSNIEADLSQMNYVIMNLCKNSIEAINKKGQILLSTNNVEINNELASSKTELEVGQYVCFTIEDTGCGIDKEILTKIFEPFFSTKLKGRGLGLAAIFGIIENHNGYISVDSKNGSGTTFKIFLPAIESSEPEIQVEQKSENKIPIGNETILIIDDEPDILDVVQSILEDFGYHILIANNGKEALDIADKFDGDIHLVILDMFMPVLDGTETFHLLKKAIPNLKTIICSGFELDSKAQSLLNSGANSFIQKPFTLEKLVREVRRILDV